jgi:hypothetical protein
VTLAYWTTHWTATWGLRTQVNKTKLANIVILVAVNCHILLDVFLLANTATGSPHVLFVPWPIIHVVKVQVLMMLLTLRLLMAIILEVKVLLMLTLRLLMAIILEVKVLLVTLRLLMVVFAALQYLSPVIANATGVQKCLCFLRTQSFLIFRFPSPVTVTVTKTMTTTTMF